jgi:hypothetical protein
MKRLALSLLALTAFSTAAALAQDAAPAKKTMNEPPRLGLHWAKGVRPARPGGGGSPDMTWHSGAIMTTTAAQSIFWGTSWASYTGDKITGMDSWYSGFGGSNYAGTSDEYTGTNGQVSSSVSYNGHLVDSTVASGGSKVAPILAEVCKVIPNAVANGYYPVYTDLPRGHAGYCAWHSYGTCGTTPVQIAFFWKLDGDAGCDPQSSVSGESQGLAAIANVSGHELSEARTDPRNGGWYDSSGAENGDKCAWTFNVPYVTFKNGTKWKIQGEWSNNAYDSGTGYANSSGQKGCIAGQ